MVLFCDPLVGTWLLDDYCLLLSAQMKSLHKWCGFSVQQPPHHTMAKHFSFFFKNPMENCVTKPNDEHFFKLQIEVRLGNSSYIMAQANLILPICAHAMIQSLCTWFYEYFFSSQKNVLFGALNGHTWDQTNAAHNLEFPNF